MSGLTKCEQCDEFTFKKTLIDRKASNYAAQEAHIFSETKATFHSRKNENYFDIYMFYYRMRFINQYELCKTNLIKELELELDVKYSYHQGLCSFHSDKVGLMFS